MVEKSPSTVTGPVSTTGIRAVLQPLCGAIVLVLAVLVSGCGPAVVEQAPREWPKQWRGRQLYATPGALIYAGSEASAGEIDRLVRSVSADIENDTHARPERGLLIVNDKGEETVFLDPNFLVQLQSFFYVVSIIVFFCELKDYFYVFWLLGVLFREGLEGVNTL